MVAHEPLQRCLPVHGLCRNDAPLDGVGESLLQELGPTERPSHRDHADHAGPSGSAVFEHQLFRRRIEQAVGNHEGVEHLLAQRPADRLVVVIADVGFGQADKAALPLFLQFEDCWQMAFRYALVVHRLEAVKLQDIHGLDAEQSQAALHRGDHVLGRRQLAVPHGAELGRQHVVVSLHIPQNAAQHSLAVAVQRRRVDEVHAELECAVDHGGDVLFGHIRALAELAGATRAQAEQRNAHTRLAQLPVYHAARSGISTQIFRTPGCRARSNAANPSANRKRPSTR